MIRTEHRCSQPADAADEMVFRVKAKTTYPTFLSSDQIRPSSIRMTMTISMRPITPTPPCP